MLIEDLIQSGVERDLAHKAEHAVDLDTGAIVGVTVQDAEEAIRRRASTLIEAAEQVEIVRPDGEETAFHSPAAAAPISAR